MLLGELKSGFGIRGLGSGLRLILILRTVRLVVKVPWRVLVKVSRLVMAGPCTCKLATSGPSSKPKPFDEAHG